LSTAQVLRDPMRPPAEIDAPAAATSAPSAAPLLQSVMIGAADRWAIIGGERVALGGRYGDARVVAITESEVVLRSAAGTRTLKMYPGIVMTQVKPAAHGARKTARKKRTDRQ
jgi:MSHA biogenesis protein MshK